MPMKIGNKAVNKIKINNTNAIKAVIGNDTITGNIIFKIDQGQYSLIHQATPTSITNKNTKYWYYRGTNTSQENMSFYQLLLKEYNDANGTNYNNISNVRINYLSINAVSGSVDNQKVLGIAVGLNSTNSVYDTSNWFSSKVLETTTSDNPINGTREYNNLNWAISDNYGYGSYQYQLGSGYIFYYCPINIIPYYYGYISEWGWYLYGTNTSTTDPSKIVLNSIGYTFDIS